jgi:hypothetical protein
MHRCLRDAICPWLQAYAEKEDAKQMKQKLRERMQPKMNRMDIDYTVRGWGWGVRLQRTPHER